MPSAQTSTGSSDVPRVEPHFLVGQDVSGLWLAVETHDLCGGLFKSREDALHFVEAETHRRPGAVELAAEPLTLRF